MRRQSSTTEQQALQVWQRFQEVVDPQILSAPRISWDDVNRRLINYINTQVAGTPWVNHLALLLAVSLCHARVGVKTTESRLGALHCRFKAIFASYGLTHFTEWHPDEHLVRYLSDPDLPDSLEVRHGFLRCYTSSTRSLQAYFHSLLPTEREGYLRWDIPSLSAGLRTKLGHEKELEAAQAL